MPSNEDLCDVFQPHPEVITTLRESIPDLNRLTELFKALGDPTRAHIIYLISRNELCVCDIAELLDSSVSNISHHLRVLRNCRLVRYRREGRQAFYRLADEHVLHLFNAGMRHLEYPEP